MDDVVKSAKSLFQDWISKDKRIAPNIRNIVYMAGTERICLYIREKERERGEYRLYNINIIKKTQSKVFYNTNIL